MDIQWTHCDEIPVADRERVEARLRELAYERNDLISVRVTAHTTQHHRHGGREIRITAKARGQQDIVSVEQRDELGLALNEALDDFEREVRRLRDRRQPTRETPRGLPPMLGIVDRIFVPRGYGFVLTDDGNEVYFHENAVRGGLRFDEMEEGQRVGLQIEPGDKGPQATAVVPVPPGVPSP